MLYNIFVELTEGEVKFRKLIWNGRSKKAPETPPIDVKKEMTKAISGGRSILVSTPETGKNISKKSK
jgi:hypothetical protein